MTRATTATLVALLVTSAGCRTEYMENAVPDLWYELSLTSAETVAGEPVGYESVIHSNVGPDVVVESLIASDLEVGLYLTDTRLFPTVAGPHVITGSVEYEGDTYTMDVDLLVDAGPPSLLDLSLSDESTAVGQGVAWGLGLWDFYGNVLDPSDVTVAVSDPALRLVGGEVVSDVPGLYHLVATLGALEDDEPLAVVAGEGASIELALSSTDLELFDTTHATVVVRDAYGNPTEDPWSLSVEGLDGADPNDVAIAYADLTFMDEGLFRVWARARNASGDLLQDSVGPLLIDTTGPLLDIWNPPRGAWNWGSDGTVDGQVGDEWSDVAGLQINGVDVAWAADGTFSAPQVYDFGVNMVESLAWDTDDNATDDTRAVLAGSFLPYGAGLGNGLEARLNEGAIDTLESLGEGLIAGTDLTSMIPSPVWSDYAESCIDLGWLGRYCWEWYSVALYIYSPSISGTDLELDPRTGWIDALATIYDPVLYWSASGAVLGIGYSGSGDIRASAITVDMDLTPYVSGGQLYVGISNVNCDTSGFDFDWDSWLWDVIDFFGFPIDSLIASLVETAVEGVIADEVPAVLEDALGSLELATDLAFEDNTYAFDAEPYAVSVDEHGITLDLATTFTAYNWLSPYTPEGSLYAGYSTPVWATTPGMGIGVSEDFINQAMLALWGGGLLEMALSGNELGLDVSELQFIFPEMTELNIEVSALLPPVVVPGTGTALLDMQMGDLELSLYGGPIGEDTLLLRAYISVFAGMDVDVDTDLTLAMELSDVTVAFDVVHPEANTLGAANTEDLLEALVPLFLPFLTDALGEIPMPAIDGFSLENITVGTGGAESGYLVLGGDLNL
ncbi:MAG: hypothetical protein ABIO70_26185 [Pseudomonadota bacterium]